MRAYYCLVAHSIPPGLSPPTEASHKRSRLESFLPGTQPPCRSSPANTLPRRRKEVTRRRGDQESQQIRTWPRVASGERNYNYLPMSWIKDILLLAGAGGLPKPLYLEVAGAAGQVLVGRQWVWQEIKECLLSHLPTNRGVLITGGPGSGKTSLLLALVDRSCFGNSAERKAEAESGDLLGSLGDQVVAYHFCQADNSPTCQVPHLVHSLAAQLSQAPQLSSYHHLLQSDPSLLSHLNINSCHTNPGQALQAGVLQPLTSLHHQGKISTSLAIILIDGLCEAEQHRPDYGDTIATFLAKHSHLFPPWLKVVSTLRSSMVETCRILPFHRIR